MLRIQEKPILAVTLGDPAGIGPEIVLKSLRSRKVYEHCRPLVIGDSQILSLRRYPFPFKVKPILNPAQARYRFGTIDVLHSPCGDFSKLKVGIPNRASGEASFLSVEKSVEMGLIRCVDGVVHAPVSKTAWKMAGLNVPGQTEAIARLCGVKKVAMAIVSEPIRTVLVTRHLPLNQVSKKLKKDEIVGAIELAYDWMLRKRIHRPRIGVCALNPHAGEQGLLGWEEKKIIRPAVIRAGTKLKLEFFGPLPADSALRSARRGEYDCLITMYHDQSLIPLKMFGSDRLVNITLGIPFVRTSPGHGTACDIAGKDRANPKPMIEAILTAARLCARPFVR